MGKKRKEHQISEVHDSTQDIENNPKTKKGKKTKRIESTTNVNSNTQEKLSKKQKKKAAERMHKARVNEMMEKLKIGGSEASRIARELQSIVNENKRFSEMKISVANAKKLLYFHRNGVLPPKEETVGVPAKKEKTIKQNEKNENGKRKSKKQKLSVETEVENVDKITQDENEVENVDNIRQDSSEERDKSVENDEDEEKVNGKKNLKKDKIKQKGQSRYVLFVGNIPFYCSTDDLKDHFNQTCSVKDVRIPLEQNSDRPRGFAYVELSDEASYQKALALHHSQFMNRVINVLYTQGGKKKGEHTMQKIKAKNFKLQALRKKGLY